MKRHRLHDAVESGDAATRAKLAAEANRKNAVRQLAIKQQFGHSGYHRWCEEEKSGEDFLSYFTEDFIDARDLAESGGWCMALRGSAWVGVVVVRLAGNSTQRANALPMQSSLKMFRTIGLSLGGIGCFDTQDRERCLRSVRTLLLKTLHVQCQEKVACIVIGMIS